METVYAEITLKNAGDVARAEYGHITEQEVRTATVTALVDTGCGSLVINEELCKTLGLSIRGLRSAELADGSKQNYQVTEPVEIHWKNRDTACKALVLPGAHGDEILSMVK